MTTGWYCSDCPEKGIGSGPQNCPNCQSTNVKVVERCWSKEDEMRGEHDD